MEISQQPKKKTSLLKKILLGIAAFFGFFLLLGIFGAIFFPIDHYKEGIDAYNKRDYQKAFDNLNHVKQDNKNYNDAITKIQEIKPIIDSLEKLAKSEKEKEDKKSNSNTTTSTTETTDNATTSSSSNGMDLKTKVANNIKSIDGGDDLTQSPMTTAQDFIVTAALFKAYVATIKEGQASSDKVVLKLTEELEKKVKASQRINFPKIRHAYYEFIKNTLWEHDINVDISGSGNTVLKLSGGYFATNKNIKTTQETFSEMLRLLRFKETQYTWYKGQDDFTYFTIVSSKDTDLEE